MKSRKNKVSRNRKTRKNIGGAGDSLSEPVTSSSMDDIAKNDLTNGFVPLYYIPTNPLMYYAADNSPVGLPMIKFEIDGEITRKYDELMEKENIVGPDGENIPYEQWKRRTKMSNPIRDLFGIATYRVSEINRPKYLFLYYLKSIFIQSYKDSDTYNKIEPQLLRSMNIVINTIDKAMKYIENTEPSVSLNEILHRLMLSFHMKLENNVFLHPFIYVYAYLFDYIITVEFVELQPGKVTINEYEFITNLYCSTPNNFEIEMKKKNGESLYYLQIKKEDEIFPFPFLPINSEARDYKKIAPEELEEGLVTTEEEKKKKKKNYSKSFYPLNVLFNGFELEDNNLIRENDHKQINIINFNDIHQEVEKFIQQIYGADSLKKPLFMRELRFYKFTNDNTIPPKLYHTIDLNNITKEELTKKMYYVFRIFAHMNLVLTIDILFLDIYTFQNEEKDISNNKLNLSQISLAVKSSYSNVLLKIRTEFAEIFKDKPNLIAYIISEIIRNEKVFDFMLKGQENITSFMNAMAEKLEVMNKPMFVDILNRFASQEDDLIYHDLMVKIDKIVIPGEGGGVELISIQDYESNKDGYKDLVQSRFPELSNYDFDDAICKVNIYPDGSFEPEFGTNCINIDENLGESMILSILPISDNTPIGRQGSNTSTTSNTSQTSIISARCSSSGRGRRGRGLGRGLGRGRGRGRGTPAAEPAEAVQPVVASQEGEGVAAAASSQQVVATERASQQVVASQEGEAAATTITARSISRQSAAAAPPPPPIPLTTVSFRAPVVPRQVPQLVKIPTVRITFNPEQINVYFQKWLENSDETRFNHQQHFLDMDKQIAYSKLFSLYGHPHIRTMPYLYANCNGMFTKDSWIEVCDEFIKGIRTFTQQYKQICEKSGGILKFQQRINLTSENNDPIAENIMVVIKANKDYIIFSVLINCMVSSNEDDRNIVIVLMRTGTANKDCKADGSEKMSITFQIMERQEKGVISLNPNYELLGSNLYEIIGTILEKRHLELKRIESIELIMMHKKAVECVQSYLDNSDSNVCGEILSRIETSVDNLMSVRM